MVLGRYCPDVEAAIGHCQTQPGRKGPMSSRDKEDPLCYRRLYPHLKIPAFLAVDRRSLNRWLRYDVRCAMKMVHLGVTTRGQDYVLRHKKVLRALWAITVSKEEEGFVGVTWRTTRSGDCFLEFSRSMA